MGLRWQVAPPVGDQGVKHMFTSYFYLMKMTPIHSLLKKSKLDKSAYVVVTIMRHRTTNMAEPMMLFCVFLERLRVKRSSA